MDRRRALDKLRKLLALAQSSNPHEAAAARSRADSLMARHHLTEDDVVEHANTDYHEVSLGDRGWTAAWRFALVTVAARSCGVEAVALQDGRRRKVRLCGARGKIAEARQFYAELLDVIRDLEKLALDEYGDELGQLVVGNSARDITDAFRQGAVIGLAAAMDAARNRRQGQAESSVEEGELSDRSPGAPAGEAKISGEVGMVLRGVRGHWPEDEHREKIREKYAPRQRPVIAEDKVSEPLVFLFGRRLAASRVMFKDDGSVELMRSKQRSSDVGVDT
jgi:hypothetical protein